MWNEKARSWRKNRRRGVSPIIATILLVAITVVLAAVLYILISGLTKGPGNAPLGSALALGTAVEGGPAGGNYWYNFTIETAGGGIVWNSVDFQVKSQGGIVAMAAATTWTVYSLTGTVVCSATGAAATAPWTAGAAGSGTTQISSTQTLSVKSTTDVIAAGDVLYASGTGSYSGTIQATIP